MNFDAPNKNKFEISKEFLEAVEKLKIDARDKANLLLTKAGLKAATEIELRISQKTEEGVRMYMTEEEVRAAVDLIKNSGLYCKIGERKVIEDTYVTREEPGAPEIKKPREIESLQAFVANSQEQLEALAKVWRTEDEEAIGLALGLPRSAVEAYVSKREKISMYDLPEEEQDKETATFLTPLLSKDGLPEEIKEGKKRAAFIKKTCPKIYDELMGRKAGVTYD